MHSWKAVLRHGATPLILAATLAGSPCASAAPANPVNAARLAAAAQEPANWMTHGGTYQEARYSPLDQINTRSIARLKLAWYGDFDTSRGQEATPLVIDGVMYTTSSWSKVYAYDAATGKLLWRHDPKVPGDRGADACCDVVNRGVAAWNGKVYVGTLDGRLEALDAKTGKLVWSTVTVDQTRPYTITGAPRVVKGKVLIGNGGAEYGVRGYVSAYDAETGALAWRFYMTPNPENKPDGAASDAILMSKAYGTWHDGAWKQTGGGGTPWDAIVYDADFDQVIIGTGNGNPWSWEHRSGSKGDNLFLGSLLALDAETGAYKWHYQETPSENWDFTSTQPIILTELTLQGRQRKVLLHAPKNGFFYVVDRKDGALISAEPFTTVNWATGIDLKTGRPIEAPGARYERTKKSFWAMPGPFGSHNWHPMAFSPKTGLTYIPVQDVPLDYNYSPDFKYSPQRGTWNTGIEATTFAGPGSESHRRLLAMQTRGALVAWDAVRQKEAWRVQHGNLASAGVLATGGNLVFQGTPDGRLVAYTADTGRQVWSWQGFDGIIAGAMTYAVGGEQYVAVVAGFGGSNALHAPFAIAPKVGLHGRILAFKLDGRAVLPDNSRPLLPPNVPAQTWPAETVSRGAALYGNCAACHGFGTYAANVIPDLRRSPMLSVKSAWDAVVLGGALADKGMPNWTGRIAAEDVEAIRAYVVDRARQLRDDEAAAQAAAKTRDR
ncbi:PQQ-dependent dehydrogenase, methanol/ethanol family [Methylibium sp. Pch-M]|nr:PQQ-dependent dehydrogenase, methanol/ethanol family [Methylibium sp. Pch-M]